jgi:glutaminyl-peptide cyclotransferase
MNPRAILLVSCLALPLAALSVANGTAQSAPFSGYKVIKTYPHDTKCYTEGLQWNGKAFYESCGQYNESRLLEYTLEGKLLRQKALDGKVFAEGLTALGGRLYQLTWQAGYGFVHDAASFKDISTFKYPAVLREGWGMTTDGKSLIVSDGTSTIRWLDPKSFAVERSITVKNGGGEVSSLNELELIGGEIWANVWMTDLVARIDPKSGQISSWVNFAGLRPDKALSDTDAVLNGIAYDATSKKIFVTGKRWDKLFEIQVVKP